MQDSLNLALKALHWDGASRETSTDVSTIDLLLSGLAGLASLHPPNEVDSEWQECVRKAFRATLPSECDSANAAIEAFGLRWQYSLRMSGLIPLGFPEVGPQPVSCQSVVGVSFVVATTRKNPQPLLQGLLACPLHNGIGPRLAAPISMRAPEFRQSTPLLLPTQWQFRFTSGPNFASSLRIPQRPPRNTWKVAQIGEMEPFNPQDLKRSTINHYRDSLPPFAPRPVRLGNWKHCQGWIPAPAGTTVIDLGTVPLGGTPVRLTVSSLFSTWQTIPDQSVMEFIQAAGFGKVESGQFKKARELAGTTSPEVIGGVIRHDPAKSRQEIPIRILQLGRLPSNKPGIFIPRVGISTLRPRIAFADGPATSTLAE